MVFAAYRDYKRWREAWQQEVREEGRAEGREVGQDAERKRIKQELRKRGMSPSEIELILSGETEDHRS